VVGPAGNPTIDAAKIWPAAVGKISPSHTASAMINSTSACSARICLQRFQCLPVIAFMA
jgi:hypothetical protein